MGLTLDQLKSGVSEDEQNSALGKNVDGDDIRDFGNGLKEFDPAANGFEHEEEPVKMSDVQKALSNVDSAIGRKKQELDTFQDLYDLNDGKVSEEELREAMGQGFITANLDDGEGGKFEENPEIQPNIQTGEEARVTGAPEQEVEKARSELDELEEELEEEEEADMKIIADETAEERGFVDPNLKRAREQQRAKTEQSEATVLALDKQSQTILLDTDPPQYITHDIPVTETVQSRSEVKEIPLPEQQSTNKGTFTEEDASVTPVKSKISATSSVTASTVAGTMDIIPAERKTVSDEDADLAALDEDQEEIDDNKAFEDKLKAEIAKKMRPVSKVYDLASMPVINKPITVNNALSNITPINKKSFTWALMNSQRPITMTGFSGTELANLNSMVRSNANNEEVLRHLYDHMLPNCKGDNFKTWAKCTSYFDVNHLWFCAYGACFADCNYVPYTCENCNEVTITDELGIYNMCKFHDPKYKDELENIKAMAPEPAMGNCFAGYEVQIADNIIIVFREPSIYDVVVFPNSLDSEFSEKYKDVIGIVAYIADIYIICPDGNGGVGKRKLITKEYPGNELRTAKARIIQYAKFIRSLPSDHYNVIIAHISALSNKDKISYQMPAISCDHCGKEIEAARLAAYDLLFTRHQLAILGV